MKLLKPVKFDKIWGYEEWIASTHKNGPQKEFVELVKNYPLLVKIIQADDRLSIQLHPDDETAVRLEGKGSSGKTECWYVLDAKPGAKLVYGLKKAYSKDELKKAVEENTLENLLNLTEVKKGDFIYIPSGTVHAIGGGLRLLEVQQNCDVTYRLYDWGRPRELHIEKGLQAVKSAAADNTQIKPLDDSFECPYFQLTKKSFQGGWSYFVSTASNYELLYIDSGNNLSATFTTPDGVRTENMYLYPEQIYAVAPGEKVTIEGKGQVIRIKTK